MQRRHYQKETMKLKKHHDLFDKNRDGFVMGEGAGALDLRRTCHALNQRCDHLR